MKNQIMIGVVALGLISGCATREDRNNTMIHESSGAATDKSLGTQFNDLPPAVQKTLHDKAPNAKVADIDKETRTGRVVYEIQFSEPGKNPKMHIAEDGTIVKSDKAIEGAEAAGAVSSPSIGTKFSDLPAAVQKTVREHSPNGKIDDIDKETRTGRVVYEIQFAEPGKNPKMHVAEDGSIVSGE